MIVDLGEEISRVRGSGFRKIGVGLCSNFAKHKFSMSSKNKPQVVATSRMGGRSREELMEIEISGNGESELDHVHYLDT